MGVESGSLGKGLWSPWVYTEVNVFQGGAVKVSGVFLGQVISKTRAKVMLAGTR